MLAVALAGIIVAISGNYLASRASTAFGRDLRQAIFSQVEKFSPQEFNKFGTASLITRTTNDVQQMQMVFLMSMRMAMRAPTYCNRWVIMVVKKDPRLALLFIELLFPL